MIGTLFLLLGGQLMKLDCPIVIIEEPKEPDWDEIMRMWEEFIKPTPIIFEDIDQHVRRFIRKRNFHLPDVPRPLLRPKHRNLGLQIYTSCGGTGH